MAHRTRIWLAFASLCLLSGSAWIADEPGSHPLTGLLRTAVHQALLALLLCIVVLVRKSSRWARPPLRLCLKIALGAVLIIALPSLLVAGAGGHVSSLTEILVFMLVPIVVVFVGAQRSTTFAATDNPLQTMLPALIALGGAGLLIPYTWPASGAGRVWLLALVLAASLAGLAADRLHRLLAGIDVPSAATLIAAVTAILSAAFCRIGWSAPPDPTLHGATIELLRALVVDLPILLLTVWLLRELRPVAFSARYFLIPLTTMSEGLILLRPDLTWTILLGALLMLGGSLALLRSDSRPDSRGMP